MVEEAALRVCGQRHSGKAMRAQSTPSVQSAVATVTDPSMHSVLTDSPCCLVLLCSPLSLSRGSVVAVMAAQVVIEFVTSLVPSCVCTAPHHSPRRCMRVRVAVSCAAAERKR